MPIVRGNGSRRPQPQLPACTGFSQGHCERCGGGAVDSALPASWCAKREREREEGLSPAARLLGAAIKRAAQELIDKLNEGLTPMDLHLQRSDARKDGLLSPAECYIERRAARERAAKIRRARIRAEHWYDQPRYTGLVKMVEIKAGPFRRFGDLGWKLAVVLARGARRSCGIVSRLFCQSSSPGPGDRDQWG